MDARSVASAPRRQADGGSRYGKRHPTTTAAYRKRMDALVKHGTVLTPAQTMDCSVDAVRARRDAFLDRQARAKRPPPERPASAAPAGAPQHDTIPKAARHYAEVKRARLANASPLLLRTMHGHALAHVSTADDDSSAPAADADRATTASGISAAPRGGGGDAAGGGKAASAGAANSNSNVLLSERRKTMTSLSPQDYAAARSIYKFIDTDASGSVELSELLRFRKENPRKLALDVFQNLMVDSDSRIFFDEFLRIHFPLIPQHRLEHYIHMYEQRHVDFTLMSDETRGEIRREYAALDGDGYERAREEARRRARGLIAAAAAAAAAAASSTVAGSMPPPSPTMSALTGAAGSPPPPPPRSAAGRRVSMASVAPSALHPRDLSATPAAALSPPTFASPAPDESVSLGVSPGMAAVLSSPTHGTASVAPLSPSPGTTASHRRISIDTSAFNLDDSQGAKDMSASLGGTGACFATFSHAARRASRVSGTDAASAASPAARRRTSMDRGTVGWGVSPSTAGPPPPSVTALCVLRAWRAHGITPSDLVAMATARGVTLTCEPARYIVTDDTLPAAASAGGSAASPQHLAPRGAMSPARAFAARRRDSIAVAAAAAAQERRKACIAAVYTPNGARAANSTAGSATSATAASSPIDMDMLDADGAVPLQKLAALPDGAQYLTDAVFACTGVSLKDFTMLVGDYLLRLQLGVEVERFDPTLADKVHDLQWSTRFPHTGNIRAMFRNRVERAVVALEAAQRRTETSTTGAVAATAGSGAAAGGGAASVRRGDRAGVAATAGRSPPRRREGNVLTVAEKRRNAMTRHAVLSIEEARAVKAAEEAEIQALEEELDHVGVL